MDIQSWKIVLFLVQSTNVSKTTNVKIHIFSDTAGRHSFVKIKVFQWSFFLLSKLKIQIWNCTSIFSISRRNSFADLLKLPRTVHRTVPNLPTDYEWLEDIRNPSTLSNEVMLYLASPFSWSKFATQA